jgi:hypothetical protein
VVTWRSIGGLLVCGPVGRVSLVVYGSAGGVYRTRARRELLAKDRSNGD